MDRLALRLCGQVSPFFAGTAPELVVVPREKNRPPRLRGVLWQPASRLICCDLRVHSGNGIPLAFAAAQIAPGEQTFESLDLTFLGLEGYAHVSDLERRDIEDRMWARRAFATLRRIDRPVG